MREEGVKGLLIMCGVGKLHCFIGETEIAAIRKETASVGQIKRQCLPDGIQAGAGLSIEWNRS